MIGNNEIKLELGLGYLPRCHPIRLPNNSGFLLPLYRENAPHFHGVILHSYDGTSWTYRGSIGKGINCIQPTIWVQNHKICALLRKFSRDNKPYAYYSESTDMGKTWSQLELTKYYNANNSILAINCPDAINRTTNTLVIWNDDQEGRNNISLGTFDKTNAWKIAMIDSYGSYPAACVHNGNLHITYTAKSNPFKTPHAILAIKHKQYNLKSLMRSIPQTI